MKGKAIYSALVLVLLMGLPAGAAGQVRFTQEFMIEDCSFSTSGTNRYFVLEPGYRLALNGQDGNDDVKVVIEVLNDTKTVTIDDGTPAGRSIETRVVRERETVNGELIEESLNYFAICQETNSVFYFGEAVDIYKNGQIVSHAGAWEAGVDGAKPGIIMPGTILLGARYFQELAAGVALDRAEILSMTARITTPAGTFENCLRTVETSPLEPGSSVKLYAPGIGLIKDGPVSLKSHGFVP